MSKSNDWYCVLLREGATDDGLAQLIESVLVDLAAEPVMISCDERTGSTVEKVSAVLQDAPGYDLVFVHRDADNAGRAVRLAEFDQVTEGHVVPVIPVKMTETWALACLMDDDDARNWLRKECTLSPATLEDRSEAKEILHRFASRGQRGGSLLPP